MRLIYMFFVSLVLVACAATKQLPPQQSGVTKIVITMSAEDSEAQQKTEQTIEDADKIDEIISYVNTRIEGWEEPFMDSLDGQVSLSFYRNNRFVGNFYVGEDFFGRDYGQSWRQDATDEEINAFFELVGIAPISQEAK